MGTRTIGFVVVLGCALFGAAAPGFAQSSQWGQFTINTRPFESVTSAGARSPGAMVSAGVARTLAAAQFGRSRIQITEPPPEPGFQEMYFEEAVDIVVDQIARTFVEIGNLFLVRAGRDPLPLPTGSGNDDDDDGGRPTDPKNPRAKRW